MITKVFPSALVSLVLIVGSFSAVVIGCSGCASSHDSSGIMTGAELRGAAVDYLQRESTQATIESALVITGGQIFERQVTDPAERQLVADQMFGLSKGFYSLATGGMVNPQDVEQTIRTFSPGLVKYTAYTAAVILAWQLIYPKLELSGAPELGVKYLLVMARAAERVAEPYRTK